MDERIRITFERRQLARKESIVAKQTCSTDALLLDLLEADYYFTQQNLEERALVKIKLSAACLPVATVNCV
jgi:hypothetical protein